MDIYDQATMKEEQERDALLAMTRSRQPSIVPKGCCYNCNEKLRRPQLFCNADCRDDWQLRNPNK